MQGAESVLERQDAYYETIREELEAEAFGKWAVVSDEKLVGVYDSNRAASEVVLGLAPERVCLVKHIGHVVDLSQLMMRVNRASVKHH